MRISGEPIEPIEPSPYTAEALGKNPHLGWQSSLVPAGANFTWRDCFKEEAQADPKKREADRIDRRDAGSIPLSSGRLR